MHNNVYSRLPNAHPTPSAQRFQSPPPSNDAWTEADMMASMGFHVFTKEIGIGHYSKVRLLENTGLGLPSGDARAMLAMKVIDLSKVTIDYRKRFLPREMELWQQMDHPHLVKMLHQFTKCSRIYMLMEWCSGGDLLAHIQRKAIGLADDEARDAFRQMLAGVRYLHERDIAHRDLKLENVLIDGRGRLKIADFGFCRKMPQHELSMTHCGSKSYSSPEILLGLEYDPFRADVWALGVILFILVTNRMPFNEHVGNNRAIVDAQRRPNLRHVANAAAKRNAQPPTPVTAECEAVIAYTMVFEWQKRPLHVEPPETLLRPTVYEVERQGWLKAKVPAAGDLGVSSPLSSSYADSSSCSSTPTGGGGGLGGAIVGRRPYRDEDARMRRPLDAEASSPDQHRTHYF